jgi:hypothetical protein
VRFALPRSGGELHVAKATWLADGDSRAEALGALVCAEVRAYKLLQSGGVAHPNVGALDAAAWAASGGAAAAQASPAPMGDAGGPNIASPRHLDGGGSCSSGSYVVLIQRYYGGQTLDSYVAARIAAAPKRMAPGALEFERILLPLVEGVAGAIAHAHGMVSKQAAGRLAVRSAPSRSWDALAAVQGHEVATVVCRHASLIEDAPTLHASIPLRD